MNVQEKEKQQRFIVQNIEGINATVKSVVKARDEYRAFIAKMNAEGTRDYSPDYVERAIMTAKGKYLEKSQAEYKSIEKSFAELLQLIQERDATLDLNNPALPGALMLIQSIGKGITFEQAVKINANFVHDQSALMALKAAYTANGNDNPGNIADVIYNVESVIAKLKDLAYKGIVQEGSINYFMTEFSKLAKLEGATAETMPDLQGAEAALRIAAGLPVA